MSESVSPGQVSPLRQLIRAGMAAALPRRRFMTAGPAGSGALALTFDDGPHPEHTPAVLERLRARGIPATFFVVGAAAAAHPGLVERMAAEGHVLGHHSWSHGAPADVSAAELAGEARRTAALVQGLAGRAPRLFRPPFGKVNASKLFALWRAGQTVVLWSRDPKDFARGSAEAIRRWAATAPLAGGDIVLLHDVHAFAPAALDAVVDRAAELGLRFTTPEEWLDD